jgi:DNA repair protein RadC
VATARIEEHLNHGHRARLLKRFEENGISALADYEVMELLLTCVLPRGDVKPIAKNLLKKFSTVSGVLNAPSDEVQTLAGIGPRSAQVVAFIKQLISYCLKEKYQNRPMIAHRKDVEEYLRFHFGPQRDEYVAALFLDAGSSVIATDIIAEGTVNQCAVYPRSIIEKALRNGAVSFILAHNHPGGGKTASEADWAITQRLFQIGKLLEIPLLDHIIITSEAAYSLREQSRWPEGGANGLR